MAAVYYDSSKTFLWKYGEVYYKSYFAHLEYFLRKQAIIQLKPKFYFHSPFTVSAGLLLAAFSV